MVPARRSEVTIAAKATLSSTPAGSHLRVTLWQERPATAPQLHSTTAKVANVVSERRAGTKSSTAAHTQSLTPQTAQARQFPRFIFLHARPTLFGHHRRTRQSPRSRCSGHGRGLHLTQACPRTQTRSMHYVDPIYKQNGRACPPHASRPTHRSSRGPARSNFWPVVTHKM